MYIIIALSKMAHHNIILFYCTLSRVISLRLVPVAKHNLQAHLAIGGVVSVLSELPLVK